MVVVVVAATARAVVLLGRWVWLLGCLVARLFLWVFGLLGSLNKNEQRETAPRNANRIYQEGFPL